MQNFFESFLLKAKKRIYDIREGVLKFLQKKMKKNSKGVIKVVTFKMRTRARKEVTVKVFYILRDEIQCFGIGEDFSPYRCSSFEDLEKVVENPAFQSEVSSLDVHSYYLIFRIVRLAPRNWFKIKYCESALV